MSILNAMPEKKLTKKQNDALHKYFRLLAEEFGLAGLDMKRTLKPEIDIPWTEESVKNNLWRPVQKSMTGKESTQDLNSIEINKIFEAIHFSLSTKYPDIDVDFPKEKE